MIIGIVLLGFATVGVTGIVAYNKGMKDASGGLDDCCGGGDCMGCDMGCGVKNTLDRLDNELPAIVRDTDGVKTYYWTKDSERWVGREECLAGK